MQILCVLTVCLVAGGQADKLPPVTALPALRPYTQEQLDALNAERSIVKACCPNTDKAMIDYGKLRDKIRARGETTAGK